MRVLILDYSSNTARSYTKITARLAQETLEDYDVIVKSYNIKSLNLKSCLNCDYCDANYGSCVHNDAYKEVLDDINLANLIINIVPMYNAQPPSEFKTLVDRAQMVYKTKYKHQASIIDREACREELRVIVTGREHNKSDFDLMNRCMNQFNRNYNTKLVRTIEINNTDDDYDYDRVRERFKLALYELFNEDVEVFSKEEYSNLMNLLSRFANTKCSKDSDGSLCECCKLNETYKDGTLCEYLCNISNSMNMR